MYVRRSNARCRFTARLRRRRKRANGWNRSALSRSGTEFESAAVGSGARNRNRSKAGRVVEDELDAVDQRKAAEQRHSRKVGF